MTLLVISPDYASHLLPLATIAAARRDPGERVVVATGPATAAVVAEFGFEHIELRLGRGSNPGVIRVEQQPAGEDDALRGFFAATRRGPVETLIYQARARRNDLLWEPVSTGRAVLRVLDRVRPDRIIVDHLAFSATLALRAAGVPYQDVVLGHPSALPVGDEIYGYPPAWPRRFAPDPAGLAELDALCRAVRDGFTVEFNAALGQLAPAAPSVADAFAAHGSTLLLNYPAALHDPHRTALLPEHVFLGASLRAERVPDDVAQWLDAGSDRRFPDPATPGRVGTSADAGRGITAGRQASIDRRPLVYVSFGSFLSAREDVLARVVAALRGLPVRVALATGSADLGSLGEIPGDWLVRGFLPQIAILRRAALTITHAGNNSVTEALACGVPLLMLPFSTDQFAGAAAVEQAGLGEAFEPNRVSAAELRTAVEQAIDTTAHRLAATWAVQR